MSDIKETFYMHINYNGQTYDIPVTKQELRKAFKNEEDFDKMMEYLYYKTLKIIMAQEYGKICTIRR